MEEGQYMVHLDNEVSGLEVGPEGPALEVLSGVVDEKSQRYTQGEAEEQEREQKIS